MAIESIGGKYEGVWINKLKNGNTSFYINYRDETDQVIKKKVEVKTKQSNYTIRDAYDRLIETKHKITTGEELPKVLQKKSRILFKDIFDNYLEWAKVNKKTWKHNDEQVYNKHLSYLGKKDPLTLKPKDFEELKQNRLKSGLSPKTVQHILGTARHIFNHAIKNDLIKNLNNPIANGKVRMPKVENQKIGFLTKIQANDLLQILEKLSNKRLYQLTVLLLFTGAHFSEIARLIWADINFNTNLIYSGPSKDGNARYIKMTNRVLEVLNILELEKTNQLVIPTKYGNMYDKMPKRWQTIVDKLIEDNKK